MRQLRFLNLLVFTLITTSTSEAQSLTKEQINAYVSQIDMEDIRRIKRQTTRRGPQIFGEQVSVTYFKDNGKLAAVWASSNPITIPLESTIQETAEKFLVDHAEQIGLKPDLSELVLRRPPLTGVAPNFVYNQHYDGYRVLNGKGRAGLGVRFNTHNQFAHFSNSLVPITEERPITFTIDREAALQRVFEKFCMLPECNESNTRHIKTEQFVRVKDGVPYGTWRVDIGLFKGFPSWNWTVWLDGETGDIIYAWENKVR